MLLLFSFCTNNNNNTETMEPPVAEKINKELTIHGHTRTDNYFWMNDRDDPKVTKYLKAENDYLKNRLKHAENFRKKLFREITGRIKQDDSSVPYKDNGYFYYNRYEEGKEYPVYCRKKDNMHNSEEVILNVNKMAEGYSYYDVGDFNVSSDNTLIAYGVDTVSRRKYTIYFKDLTTGKIFEENIPNTTGSVAWANDNKTVFYSIKDNTLRSYMIKKHVLGTAPSEDEEIFHEKDSTYDTYVYKTKSSQFIIIGSGSTLSDEYRFLDANDPDGEFRIIQTRERELEYKISHFGDHFYIVTNMDAKNFRLMKTRVDNTAKENWEEVIPHRDNVLIEGIEIFKDFLIVEERKSGLNQIRIIRWDDQSEHYLDFGEETYSAWVSTNREFDSEILRYGYSSLTTPDSWYDYNMVTREKKLLKREPVLGDFDPDRYEAKRLYAPAEDGIKIPISLVYRKGIKKNSNNPLLVYAYGSYGASRDPYFRSDRLSLLDRGFVFAIAHVRGGSEMGRYWYEDGKLLKKKNTFTDFINCTEFLIKEKYSNPEKTFAYGGSAGGLLIGAVINMRPDLYKAVIAAVPFVDVITTMLDESIPLTTGEYDEWGNPNEKKYYDYIVSYSPYDNVEAKDYPAMLVTTGLHDSQVQYWEPAKWVAKLRDMKTDDNLLLLFTNMEAGHGGASGRLERYREIALEYTFFLDQIGIYE